MKINNYLQSMKCQEIPINKIREYAPYLNGFCNQISGRSATMESSIEYIKENNLKGSSAINYIDKELERLDERLNRSLIENLASLD